MGAVRRLIAALPLVATLAATGWALSSNPLAAPFVDRVGTDLALTLERQVRQAATSEWIEAALAQAVIDEDADRARMLIGLAQDLNRPVSTQAADAMIARRSGTMASAIDCAKCMADTATCPSLTQVAICAVPFEMSPLGDLNALRRAGMAWMLNEPVDRLDAGLAVAGLAATGATLVTVGSSATIKAGTTLLRVARRMGSLTPAFVRNFDLPIRWDAMPDFVAGRVGFAAVTDVARLRRLQGIGADLGRVRDATSTGEALRLTRLIDTPEDAARLARVAEAAGPKTTRTFAVLGKARVFRATVRLSRAAAGTLILLWLAFVQIGVVLATRAGALTLRLLMARGA